MPRIVGPTLFRSLSSLLVVAALAGCVVPPAPYEEYSLARTAIRAAQEADSARFATGLWHRAEESYRNGQKAYKDSEFAEAKKHFIQAQQFAERAENVTRLKKFQSGESFP